MAAPISADDLIRVLTAKHRVLMLGGLAVIAHGLARKTKDVDVWLEPMPSAADWSESLHQAVKQIPSARYWSLAERRYLRAEEVRADVEDFGVLRISGLDRDVDVFRKPNELELTDFEHVWNRSTLLQDGVHLPHELDLYITKANTGREHDLHDQLFLERRVKDHFREQLPNSDLIEAKELFARFTDPEVLSYALTNSDADVRNYALELLREFEAEGDPFSRDILAAWKEPT